MQNNQPGQHPPIFQPSFNLLSGRWEWAYNMTPAAQRTTTNPRPPLPPGVSATGLRLAELSPAIGRKLLGAQDVSATAFSQVTTHPYAGLTNHPSLMGLGADKNTQYSRIESNPEAAVEALDQRQTNSPYGQPTRNSAAGGPYYILNPSGPPAAALFRGGDPNSPPDPPAPREPPPKRRRTSHLDSIRGTGQASISQGRTSLSGHSGGGSSSRGARKRKAQTRVPTLKDTSPSNTATSAQKTTVAGASELSLQMQPVQAGPITQKQREIDLAKQKVALYQQSRRCYSSKANWIGARPPEILIKRVAGGKQDTAHYFSKYWIQELLNGAAHPNDFYGTLLFHVAGDAGNKYIQNCLNKLYVDCGLVHPNTNYVTLRLQHAWEGLAAAGDTSVAEVRKAHGRKLVIVKKKQNKKSKGDSLEDHEED
ncbi:Hypothetical predicted protein [Lecanosticta acicola]|uniref:Uncharacterized protein n=1 Tax=Lecanosticta acicola TaxID=111012 RepID=A0AAI8YX58_9PEZI|nr:Hypothetical predicted protein [Lecanosticta acicola]